MGIWNKACNFFSASLLEYETQKVVQIHSKKVGGAFRLIQMLVMLYFIIWVMIWEKGYQSKDTAQSGVTAKLKGIAFANLTGNSSMAPSVFDAADYVIPPQQKAAFFVMTNLIITPGQTMGRCEEAHVAKGNECITNADCRMGTFVDMGNGMRTGKCMNSTQVAGAQVCEIYGWCPTEHDNMLESNILTSAPNFTVILKNSIEFPKFKVKRRNILRWMNKTFLHTCRYEPKDAKQKFCPIFKLADIMKYTKANTSDIWRSGGMISIQIEWDCNLDFDKEECLPAYTFHRLDDFNGSESRGWNFRFSRHYMDNGVHRRNLIRAYGIQFFITVYGTGGRFNILTFTMNLGSGLALLGIATAICDMIILNCTRNRRVYRDAKVDLVERRERRLHRQMGRRRGAPIAADGLDRAQDTLTEAGEMVDQDTIDNTPPLGFNQSARNTLQDVSSTRLDELLSKTRLSKYQPPKLHHRRSTPTGVTPQ